MKLNTLIIGSLIACCAGCAGEKAIYVPVIRDDSRSNKSVDCKVRIVKVFGIDNGYFANTNRFNPNLIQTKSNWMKLEKPFGPFESIAVELTDSVPAVVDVSNADRSAMTNGFCRLWLNEIELSHDYEDKASAERMVEDFYGIVNHLNGVFDTDLDLPKWPAVIDKDVAESRRGEQQTYLYLTENGQRPKMIATYNLVEQRVTIEAEEGLYGKRGNDVVLLCPSKIRMNIQFSGIPVGLCEEDFSEEIPGVTVGASIAKRLTFGKIDSRYNCWDRQCGRPRYEYNVDTKRITTVPTDRKKADKIPNALQFLRLGNDSRKAL